MLKMFCIEDGTKIPSTLLDITESDSVLLFSV